MKWSHTVIVAEPNNGQVHVGIEFTDGVTTFRVDWNVSSLDDLKRRITSELLRLESLSELLATVAPGVPVDVTPKPTVPSDKALYFASRDKLRAMQSRFDEDVKNGIIKQDDAARLSLIADQLAVVKSLYLPEYEESPATGIGGVVASPK